MSHALEHLTDYKNKRGVSTAVLAEHTVRFLRHPRRLVTHRTRPARRRDATESCTDFVPPALLTPFFETCLPRLLVKQAPLIADHDGVLKCATCAAERGIVPARPFSRFLSLISSNLDASQHSLAHSAASPFFPRSRTTAAREMRAF
ncbi:hypothetical protein OF846_004549 [Rhodotorula toruloides]|nr:hypothetical protein OF846_004549 [Rhodotorula toruloides]